MYHDDNLGLAFMRHQFEKEEKRTHPLNTGTLGLAKDLKRPTPRGSSCDAVALKTTSNPGALKPPFFTRPADDAPTSAVSSARPSARLDQTAQVLAGPASSRPTPRSSRPSARGSAGQATSRTTSRTARTDRDDDVLETVRSNWPTARVERKYTKLMEEKAAILARIQEVDAALEAEQARNPKASFGRTQRGRL